MSNQTRLRRVCGILIAVGVVAGVVRLLWPPTVRACDPVTVSVRISGVPGAMWVGDKIEIWADGHPGGGTYSWSATGGTIEPHEDPNHSDANYIAGTEPGPGSVTVVYTHPLHGSATDTVSFYIVWVDLQIDSSNDGTIGPEDDLIEHDPNNYYWDGLALLADPNFPGKIVPLNLPEPNDSNNLVPIVVSAEGGGDNAKWRFEQLWSVPLSMGYVYVWRDQGKTEFVDLNDPNLADPNHWYPASDMGTFYVEGALTSMYAGSPLLAMTYNPDVGGEKAGEFVDGVAITVAQIVLDVTLPNGFVGSLDEDYQRYYWGEGVRQRAENTIKVDYRLFPNAVYACDTSTITLLYTGDMWTEVGQELPEGKEDMPLDGEGGLPGASGTAWRDANPDLNVAEGFDGINPSDRGGEYDLVFKSYKTLGATLCFSNGHERIQALPLVEDFAPSWNPFCPFTTRFTCPTVSGYPNPEVYWGVQFGYRLNANVVGYDFAGSLAERIHGDSAGLEIQVVGKTLNVVPDSKVAGLRRVKWEGYQAGIDEPGGEPYFWGPHDPARQLQDNVCDYPSSFWGIVPAQVVAETLPGHPLRVDLDATGYVDEEDYPGCRQVYERTQVPVEVEYDLTNVSQ